MFSYIIIALVTLTIFSITLSTFTLWKVLTNYRNKKQQCDYCYVHHLNSTSVKRNDCPFFIEKKDQCSKESYICLGYTCNEYKDDKVRTRNIDTQLENLKLTYPNNIHDQLLPHDSLGFCAAGVLPYYIDYNKNKTYILVAKEKRSNGEIKYCFIGGKRDKFIETPYLVAAREFKEETQDFLKDINFKSVYNAILRQFSYETNLLYYAPGKYVLHTVKLPIQLYETKPYEPNNVKTNDNIVDLTWICLNNITKDEFHAFSYSMLEDIEKYCGKNNLFFY